MNIDIFTNSLPGGWSPEQVETGLGGSEEAVTLFARELAKKGFTVKVFIATEVGKLEPFEWEGITFLDRLRFEPWEERDILITWKDHTPWVMGSSAKRRKIHWTGDKEKQGNWIGSVDYFVNMSEYQAKCNDWASSDKAKVIQLGVDLRGLVSWKVNRKKDTMLYCSSFDRGLEDLLRRWPIIKDHYPKMKLTVTYGWDFIDILISRGIRQSNELREFKAKMVEQLRQDGIDYVGRVSTEKINQLYWESVYWALPLNRAESEMFCLNAVKANFCGCIGVVNWIGALQNTVKEWVDFEAFWRGKRGELKRNDSAVSPMDWNEVIEKYWLPLFGA